VERRLEALASRDVHDDDDEARGGAVGAVRVTFWDERVEDGIPAGADRALERYALTGERAQGEPKELGERLVGDDLAHRPPHQVLRQHAVQA